MCRFVEIMENFQGDLTDIVRGTAVSPPVHEEAWRDPLNFISTTTTSLHDPSCTALVDASFGDPFSAMSDPLLHELHQLPLHEPSSSTSFFIAPPPAGPAPPLVEDGFCGGETSKASNSISGSSSSSNNNNNSSNMSVLGGHYKIFDQDDASNLSNPPCGILSRIQISPSGKAQMGCDSPAMVSPRGGVKKADVVINAKAGGCFTDGAGQGQISSPRNLGVKRRKNQAKKVVCIPAPAAANSRSTGEVVPSDLWAWRKYGQKPIKGSPYPRGYYRCSSSKGCSARKQVERSRTDPNTLVITYTSEHNHPWPTQRNALAGSTRSQASKATTAKKSDAVEAAHRHHQSGSASGVDGAVPDLQSPSTDVKEEELIIGAADDEINKKLAAGDGGAFSSSQCYRPEMISPEEAGSNYCHHHQEDLFAGLDEIEADPLNDLLFSGVGDDDDDDEASTRRQNGGVVDPFASIFDWSGEMIRRRSLSP